MEHGPFIDGLPIKNGDFPAINLHLWWGFSMAVLKNQRVDYLTFSVLNPDQNPPEIIDGFSGMLCTRWYPRAISLKIRAGFFWSTLV